ncbi:MAG: hypothetical protein AAGH81_07340, partial [Bacteroidota bacterium]
MGLRNGSPSFPKTPRMITNGFLCIILAAISLLISSSYAQDMNKDSLLAHYKGKAILTYSTENIRLLNRLAESYRFRNPDSLLLFTKELNDLSKKNNDFKGITLGKIREGNYYSDIGNHQKALEKYFEAEELLLFVDEPKL